MIILAVTRSLRTEAKHITENLNNLPVSEALRGRAGRNVDFLEKVFRF